MNKLKDPFLRERYLLIIFSIIASVMVIFHVKYPFIPTDVLLLILLLLNSFYIFITLLKLPYYGSTAIYISLGVGVAAIAFITKSTFDIEFVWDANKVHVALILAAGEFIAYSLSNTAQKIIYIRTDDESIQHHLPKVPFEIKKSFYLLAASLLFFVLILLSRFFLMDEVLISYYQTALFLPLIIHLATLLMSFLFKDEDAIKFNKNILQESDRRGVLSQICTKLSNKESKYCRKTNTMQYQTILHYLNNGQDPNEVINDKYTLLLPGTCCGDLKLVKLLVENGVNVNFRSPLGTSALHLAAKHGFYDIANLLIQNNAEVDVTDEDGKTPLIYANENGHIEIASLLINANNHSQV